MSRPFAASFRSINPLAFARHAAKQGRNVRYGGQRSYASSDPAPFPMAQRRSLLRPINFLVVLVPFFTASLGVWQVKRLRWKLDLIDEVQANIEREPMVLPPNINVAALPDFAFRRVLLKGMIVGPPLLLGPAVQHGVPGSYIVQQFQRSDPGASSVLLNRGFITKTREDAIRAGTQVPMGVSGKEEIIEGMLTKKFDDGKGRWAHENEPENNRWFWKDVPGMAAWLGGEEKGVQAVLVEAIDYGDNPPTMLMQEGIPVGRSSTIELRNQHATYAITWFSLSAATGGMLIFLLRRGAGAKKLPKTMRPIT